MPATFAKEIDQPWCDLESLSEHAMPSRNGLAAAVIDALLPALERFEREGLAPFLARWQALDVLAGKPVRVLDGGRVEEGIARGIDEQGALRVQHGQQERHYHGGEVSLRNL
jgi:BirA family biotin operon repressor/biotin-[acetyl-CoA-carboxylase] ligase